MDPIPDDVKKIIIGFLEPKDLLNLMIVNKKLKAIIYPIFLRVFTILTSTNPICLPFRTYFRELIKNQNAVIKILQKAKQFKEDVKNGYAIFHLPKCVYDKVYKEKFPYNIKSGWKCISLSLDYDEGPPVTYGGCLELMIDELTSLLEDENYEESPDDDLSINVIGSSKPPITKKLIGMLLEYLKFIRWIKYEGGINKFKCVFRFHQDMHVTPYFVLHSFFIYLK